MTAALRALKTTQKREAPAPGGEWPDNRLVAVREALLLADGHPIHLVAAWLGHDPRVLVAIYAHARRDELHALGTSCQEPEN